jgi:hypothetical protein
MENDFYSRDVERCVGKHRNQLVHLWLESSKQPARCTVTCDEVNEAEGRCTVDHRRVCPHGSLPHCCHVQIARSDRERCALSRLAGSAQNAYPEVHRRALHTHKKTENDRVSRTERMRETNCGVKTSRQPTVFHSEKTRCKHIHRMLHSLRSQRCLVWEKRRSRIGFALLTMIERFVKSLVCFFRTCDAELQQASS